MMLKHVRILRALALASLLPMTGAAQSAGNDLSFASKTLGESRRYAVHLPASYSTNVQARYPVLYVTDAQTHFEHIISTVNFLARNDRIPEMIVVGLWTEADRTRDLTPTRGGLVGPQGFRKFPTSGGSGEFSTFLLEELIPHVEKNFRTRPYRVLAGHSFGGLLVMHMLATAPDSFNGYIAASPVLTWDRDLVERELKSLTAARKHLMRDLFFTMGNEEGPMVEGFRRLEKQLKANAPEGFRWSSMYLGDDDHGSVVLPTYYHGLRSIFSDWKYTLSPTTKLEDLEEHFARVTKRLGYETLPPEYIVNRLGYQFVGTNNLEDAVRVFKRNVELYPQSANVYDSLGEIYEKQGNLALARDAYANAVAVGEKSKDENLATFKENLVRVTEKLK